MMLQLQSNSTFAQLEGKLGVLDKHLLQHTYLVGQSVSLADVIVIVDLIPAFQKVNPLIQLSSFEPLLQTLNSVEMHPRAHSSSCSIHYRPATSPLRCKFQWKFCKG